MPRKGNVPKREVLPDPVYGSVVVAKLINSIMLDGKKGTAQAIVYDAFEQIRNSVGYPHLNVKIGATHAGITVGEDGSTHQCPRPRKRRGHP